MDCLDSLLSFPDVFTNRSVGHPLEGRRDSLLPGRLLQAMSEGHRTQLIKMLNGPPPADWWIKLICGK